MLIKTVKNEDSICKSYKPQIKVLKDDGTYSDPVHLLIDN
jgi:hypothetical protein